MKKEKPSKDKVERQAVLILRKRNKTLRNGLQIMDKQDIRLIKALKSNYHMCKEELISMIANLLS